MSQNRDIRERQQSRPLEDPLWHLIITVLLFKLLTGAEGGTHDQDKYPQKFRQELLQDVPPQAKFLLHLPRPLVFHFTPVVDPWCPSHEQNKQQTLMSNRRCSLPPPSLSVGALLATVTSISASLHNHKGSTLFLIITNLSFGLLSCCWWMQLSPLLLCHYYRFTNIPTTENKYGIQPKNKYYTYNLYYIYIVLDLSYKKWFI